MRLSFLSLLLLSFITFIASPAFAQADAKVTVYAISGDATYTSTAVPNGRKLTKGDELPLTGMIAVGQKSRLGLRFADGRLIRLREKSQLELSPASGQSEEELNLVDGAMHLFNRLGKTRYTVKTPEVSAAIRGTEIVASRINGESTVTVYDGEVLLEAQSETLRLTHGESGAVKQGEAPRKVQLLKPTEQVEWALYFPVVLLQKDYTEYRSHGNTALVNVYELAFSANFKEALQALPQGSNTPELRSALLTLAGAPGEARAILNGMNSDEAKAQLGVLALLTNDRKQAELLSQQVGLGKSPTAYLLKALLRSTSGDIAGASEIISAALAMYPDEPTFLARRAELELGLGKNEEALETAKQAYAIRPSDPFVTSILGFAYLARQDSTAAEQSFQAALASSADFPEANFGRALSLLGQGKLAEGRQALERTVHLDSARSLYRSYLGKAFFEEELEDNAEKEYG
ncbi:MAG: FecR domain-containing protein, partial [Bdellovibrionales bacterium]|nr:FecR domain-containing protein [Bdellovibrionales bacterium]